MIKILSIKEIVMRMMIQKVIKLQLRRVALMMMEMSLMMEIPVKIEYVLERQIIISPMTIMAKTVGPVGKMKSRR